MKNSGTRLGQNFLIDEAACLRIANAVGSPQREHGRTVVEIGPGHGAITAPLAARCARLHCIEFDPHLARELAFRFRNDTHVTVHQADILKTDLRSFLPEVDPGSDLHHVPERDAATLDVVGNLPYYITSDILLHLFGFARAGLLRCAVLMMQREVAVRIASPAGASDYGPLSALAQLHGSVTELFTLPPGAFSPPPDVYSTVVRLDFAPRFAELGLTFESFNPFLRSTFAQKRKTLANNLRNAGYTGAQLTAAWPEHLPAQVRSEAVSLDDLAALYRALTPASGSAG